VKRFRIGILLAVLVAVLLTATPVYADTADPDSPPIVTQKDIYRNIRETGDMLILIYANIPYASLPDTPVNETFIWRLIDTDGTTELGSTVGYPYNESGYNQNLYSMYFTAAEVTTLGIVWGTSYTIRLSGNPAVFDDVPIYNYTINAGDYSLAVTQADVQEEIAERVIVIAGLLDLEWGLSPAYSLLTEAEASTVLSIYGEAFFRGAINGLQAMAPAAFFSVIRDIDVADRTWTDEYTTNLTDQWSGTWVETATAAGQVLFGTTYDLLSIILLLGMSGGLLLGNIMLTGDHWNGLIDVSVIGIIGARLGMYDFAFLLLVAALCWIYISLKVWFGMIK